jgi:galactokinase
VANDLLTRHLGAVAGDRYLTQAPGRVNLIGEHTDYNGLPVFPMAIQRRITIRFAVRDDSTVRLANVDDQFPPCAFELSGSIDPDPAGAWVNYVKAAAQALCRRHGALHGIDGVVSSDLPVAAGLSSSSALTVATALSLLHGSEIDMEPLDLMNLVAEGERYVGTAGGGMDQAICLGGQADTALKIDFDPLRLTPTAVPSDWRFVVASSMVRAEKSGAVRETYNRRGAECREALEVVTRQLPEARGVTSYAELMGRMLLDELVAGADGILDDPLRRRFRHVVTEADRVEQARLGMVAADLRSFGGLMSASHESLRDDYEVSCDELDELVDLAMASGAVGARLTGAGLGGCIVALCLAERTPTLVGALREEFYGARGVNDPENEHLIVAEPSQGASVTPL